MVFTFPYDDPGGTNNELFRQTLPVMKEIFSLDLLIGYCLLLVLIINRNVIGGSVY